MMTAFPDKNDNTTDLVSVACKFGLDVRAPGISAHGSGHIHDTYLLQLSPEGNELPDEYILQRINHNVFPDPPGVMENITRVTDHLKIKLRSEGVGGDKILRRVLTVVPTVDGKGFLRDTGGRYWRLYRYISGSTSYDQLPSSDDGYRIAFKFGEFIRHLHDFPDPPLHETINDFHNGPKRFMDFQTALESAKRSDRVDRVVRAREAIDFLFEQARIFKQVQTMIESGRLPLRVTHNDTKVNNILIDRTTREALCVIDLDTVMPGSSLYDFGDLARTTLSSAPEDEADLSKVSVDKEVLKAITEGFLDGARDALSPLEKDYLFLGVQYMTLLIGMRFLTDYLQGDTYFKIRRPQHNLDRARRQFRLVQLLFEIHR